jgi:peptidyl-dipeptidase A
MPTPSRLLVALAAAAGLAAPSRARPVPDAGDRPTAAEARAFVAGVNAELKRLRTRSSVANWIQQTFITDDTQQNAAWANEDLMAYLAGAIQRSLRFRGLPGLDPETERALHLLRFTGELPPAPADRGRRAELAAVAARLDAAYGKGKWCGADGKGPCRDLDQLSEVLKSSREWDALAEAWAGWHAISPPMRPDYERLVALANEGAREIGFRDLGERWRGGYDMPPADFERDVDRLWSEVKPLYDDLHCYVRARLQRRYGRERVPDGKPIPAHLLGDMWAQQWSNVYDLVEPYPIAATLDVDAALKREGYDPARMVRLAESFFTSLGLDPLPPSFWARSMLSRPRDREVVCHASAEDVTFGNDLRVKMCIQIDYDNLVTIHHELGHDYYFMQYWKLPILFQDGANDGFHEAIGDAVALSVTPEYLRRVGLLGALPADEKALIDVQMKQALDKVAFLPFAKLVDRWRWDVFSGKTPPDRYNAAWWSLRRELQGVEAPVPRSEADFDPGAKYHVPANVPYARYFLAYIYQFQFHRALCRAAGQRGPLHACSIHGSREAGRRLAAMMALGASRPWPEAMFALTGERRAEASAILEYFAPLRAWLREQNRGRRCGW